jgi:hypothetical protein
MMSTKPKLFLLDADVIIALYELGIWGKLLEAADVAVGATVVHTEALFYSKSAGGIPEDINLPRLVSEGRILELSATVEDIQQVRGFFKPGTNASLHDGEIEALALLASGRAGGRRFCTADQAAIQALAMLGLSANGVSLEAILGLTGLQRSLPHQYSEASFQRHIGLGQTRHIQGEGIPFLD